MSYRQRRKTVNKADINRQKESLKTMYFNRFLLIRYILAIFIFTHFYWFCMTWKTWISIVPGALFLLSMLPAVEMFKMLGVSKPKIKWTIKFFKIQNIVCITMAMLFLIIPVHVFVPILTNILLSRIIVMAMCLLGFGLTFLVNKRLIKIESRTDKQYLRIRQYERSIRLHL